MSNNPFQKAVKTQVKLRLALDGPSGSGKTYTALIAAKALANSGKIAVIDTERGSAALYSDLFEFDTVTLEDFNPKNYCDMIEIAEQSGYAVIVIDSLSHAWEGEGGALDMVDAASARSQSKNSYFAWREVTPLHRKLVDAMLQSKCHIIATMRSRTEYVVEEIERNGHKMQVPRKIGMAPIQRQGMEYEFTIVGDMDLEHNLVISKSRMATLADAVKKKPDEKFFGKILDWLNSGASAPSTPPAQFKPATSPIQPPAPSTAVGGGDLEPLGEALYPGGMWGQKKAAIYKHYTTDKAVLGFLEKRKADLSTNGSLVQHVSANWPGCEALIELVRAQAGAAFDPLQFLEGAAALAELQRAKPEQFAAMTTEQLAAVAMSKLVDAAIPEEFR